jgi:hypothetical protein
MNPQPAPLAPEDVPQATLFNGLVTCPHCGGWSEPGADSTGQVALCPHCGGQFRLPESIDLGFAPPSYRPGALPPREPWFYHFIDTYAKVWMWLALLGTALTILAAAAVIFTVRMPIVTPAQEHLIKGGFLTLTVVGSVSGLIGILLSVAFMRLAVDIARNLRAIRHHHREGRS